MNFSEAVKCNLDVLAEAGFVILQGALEQFHVQSLLAECAAHTHLISHSDPLLDQSACVVETVDKSILSHEQRTDSIAFAHKRIQVGHKLAQQPCGQTACDTCKLAADACNVYLDVFPRALASNFGFTRVFLFNEQYVVKMPRGGHVFPWHRDDAEQLKMLQGLSDFPDYVSLWAPLVDTDEYNGTLRVIPLNCYDSLVHPPPRIIQTYSKTLAVKAGDIVVFRSRLWHSSSRNDSESKRPVAYAQYSPDAIYAPSARGGKPQVLSLAVEVSTSCT